MRHSPSAELLSKNAILLHEILDDLLLVLVHPARNGDDPKSKSGPRSSGQLVPRMHPMVKLSLGVTWLDHKRLPVARSKAR